MISRLLVLLAAPTLIAILCIFGPFTTDPALLFSGLAIDPQPGWLPGFGTADPNMGITSDALGKRAALEIFSGTLPLWDHLEGLGAPLLGSMQPAALFPPTLLLLLPHGQVIEQTLLQFIAGLGTYLLLRRFGLGPVAALAGGVLFEMNGAFAMLRNAAFNPVAFLPWLLFVVEGLRRHAASTWRERLPLIGVGALAAASALYAGFPEVVYFYTLLIVAWTIVRLVAMPLRDAARVAGSLAAAAVLALLIAAPQLLAFMEFLPEAELSYHGGTVVTQAALSPASLVLTLLPYVYGPIAAAPVQATLAAWSGIGGYLGLMPALLAIAGLYCGRRAAICWLMAGWSLASIAVSHGAPILHVLFLHVPLVANTLFFRYLDAGSILCCVILSAVFLDRLPTLSAESCRRVRWIALSCIVAVLGLALLLAAPALTALWRPGLGYRSYGFGSLAVACGLLLGFALTRSRPALISLAVAEAAFAFVFPLASFPRAHRLDRPLIVFLQEHVGLQRMAVAASAVLYPNYGPAFGFASINYDNLPVPARTEAYARANLDPKVDLTRFWPTTDQSRGDDELRSVARAHVIGYENAAVRYLVGAQDLFGTPAYELAPGALTPMRLLSGEQIRLQFKPRDADIRDALLFVGTDRGAADGVLRAQLCQDGNCGEATANLADAADGRFLRLRFAPPLAVTAGRDAEITLRKVGGTHSVVLWARLAPPPASDTKPILLLASSETPRSVFESTTASVFELPHAQDYATAPGCRVTATSRDQFQLECDAPARMIRREVWMQGWNARLNGALAPVHLAGDTFQAVDVPAGRSSVAFSYDPVAVRSSIYPAVGALLVALALLASAYFPRLDPAESGKQAP